VRDDLTKSVEALKECGQLTISPGSPHCVTII